MKNILCNVNEKKCEICEKTDKCIYYMLSGEDFKNYPAIIVCRDFFEKRKFQKNSEIILTFYLIGVASQYVGFITNYFDVTQVLDGCYFQKYLLEQIIINNNTYYDGVIEFKTPIKSIDEIKKMIIYYNTIYKTNISIPKIEILNQDIPKITDYNKYIINNHLLKYDGYKYKMIVRNYAIELFEIGIGKTACIGGGRANANKNSFKFE